jgi:hypothetical protein
MILNATNSNFLFREIDNPFLSKTTEYGLVLDGAAQFSGDSGEIELANKIIGTGLVTSVGVECKTLAVGDVVFYDRRGPRPLITDNEILWVTNELNVFAYSKSKDL